MKQYFKLAIITFIVVIAAGLVRTCSEVGDQKWLRESSIYDIQNEVQIGRVTNLPYGFLLKAGVPDDSLVLRPIIAFNNWFYERGLSKIPEGDGERYRLWYIFKFWPYKFGAAEKYAEKTLPESLEVFKKLSSSAIKSDFYRIIESNYTMLSIIYYFSVYVSSTSLPDDKQQAFSIDATNWLLNTCPNLDPVFFIKNGSARGDRQVPLDCMRWQISYMEHSYAWGHLCDRISREKISEAYTRMHHMLHEVYIPNTPPKENKGLFQDVANILENYEAKQEAIMSSPERCRE